MASFFISYSRVDTTAARCIADHLRKLGHDVWMDQERLTGAEDWWRSICGNIRRSSYFLFVATESSLLSTVCSLERTYAESLGKHIVPLCLDKRTLSHRLPVDLSKTQALLYQPESVDSIIQLAKAIANLPPPSPLPDPAPEEPPLPSAADVRLDALNPEIALVTSLERTIYRTLRLASWIVAFPVAFASTFVLLAMVGTEDLESNTFIVILISLAFLAAYAWLLKRPALALTKVLAARMPWRTP